MRLSSRLCERYIIAAILPYLGLALLLLTTILLAQQATRFAEILGGTRAPLTLAGRVLLGLLPNILLFTLPMAVLAGTATGFSRMGSDSELTALKAAGVGNLRIIAPVLGLGLIAAVGTLYDGLILAPEAARQLRQTAVRAALYKLASPVEPNTFNTELPGKVIYVRDGDQAQGLWGRVFIQWQAENQPTRIVTARTGRIDTSRGQSELVLSDAMVTTLPALETPEALKTGPIITERSAQLRVRLDTGREALVEKLQAAPTEPDELSWPELLIRKRTTQGDERRKILLVMHRRLALCCAPLALALLGAGLGVRVRRGGRGLGVLLSLAAMVLYYLLLLAGEQLGRRSDFAPELGPWLACILATAVGSLLLMSQRRLRVWGGWAQQTFGGSALPVNKRAVQRGWRYGLLGLLDRSVLRTLTGNFVLAQLTLIGIFLIFTLFELLRFATTAKLGLLARYLFFLIPLAGTSITPVSVLVSVLVSYALLARRREAVAWWAGGQSTYRLSVPGLIFAVLVGLGLWQVEERVLPPANLRQESLRTRIRTTATQSVTAVGQQWLLVPESHRLYSYRYEMGADILTSPVVFEFDAEGVHVQRLIAGTRGQWATAHTLRIEQAKTVDLRTPQLQLGRDRESTAGASAIELSEPTAQQLFKPVLNKPMELNMSSLRRYAAMLRSRGSGEARSYEVAVARRWADPFAPLIMTLLGLPLALAFGRRTALTALSMAVGVGLLFWGCVSGFQQLGLSDLLPPVVAAWGPLLVFTAFGTYLMSRTRT